MRYKHLFQITITGCVVLGSITTFIYALSSNRFQYLGDPYHYTQFYAPERATILWIITIVTIIIIITYGILLKLKKL